MEELVPKIKLSSAPLQQFNFLLLINARYNLILILLMHLHIYIDTSVKCHAGCSRSPYFLKRLELALSLCTSQNIFVMYFSCIVKYSKLIKIEAVAGVSKCVSRSITWVRG